MKPRGQSLSSDNLQAVLESSKTALQKGTQQFLTPPEYASALCLPLPVYRSVILDLHCGSGALLRGAANHTTKTVLGFDIDPRCTTPNIEGVGKERGVGDVTKLYPLLMNTKTKFDIITVNPPFSLKWDVEGLGKNLDSTLATFEMICNLLSPAGDALMICNASTAERLLKQHTYSEKIWLWVTLPSFFKNVDPTMRVAALYINNMHDEGPKTIEITSGLDSLESIRSILTDCRQFQPLSSSGGGYHISSLSKRGFLACCHEIARTESDKAGAGHDYNIWLDSHGKIKVYLTGFQELSTTVPRDLAERLFSLQGRHPLELVVQASTRDALREAVTGSIWRVHPSVVASVELALSDYNDVRAPFVKLNEVQRLGYLDEERYIVCRNSMGEHFKAGCTYELNTRTVRAKKIEYRKRHGRPDEEVLVTGHCLVVDVTSGDVTESFTANPDFHDFPSRQLQSLVWHFSIPEVHDVAVADPERFEDMKMRLRALHK